MRRMLTKNSAHGLTKTLTHAGRIVCKAKGDGTMTVEGYASTFNTLDSDGDIVQPGAYTKTIAERFGSNLIKMCYQHNPLAPIGKFIEMEEDEVGLRFKAVLADTPTAREAYALMKAGVIDRFSIGYDVVKHRKGTPKELGLSMMIDRPVRLLDEVKLFEISPVTFAANESATLTAVKRRGLWVVTSRKEMMAGAFVAWPGTDGDVFGRIDTLATSGDVETDNGTIAATTEDPVATIVVYAPEGDGWTPTDQVVRMQLSGLSEIDPLMEPTTAAASAEPPATSAPGPAATPAAEPTAGAKTAAARKAMAIVRQRLEVGTRVAFRLGALDMVGAITAIAEAGTFTITDPLVLAAMWDKMPCEATPDSPVLDIALDDGTAIKLPTRCFGVSIDSTPAATGTEGAVPPKSRAFRFGFKAVADPPPAAPATPASPTAPDGATTTDEEPAAEPTPNANEFQPPEEVVAMAAEAVALIDGGQITEGVEDSLVEMGRRIADGSVLTAADVEAGARLWVERGEEMTAATDGPAFLAASLLGGMEGEHWFLMSFATSVVRGGTSPAPSTAANDGADEAKAGRILSQANLGRLESALKLVKNVVDDEKRRGRSSQKPKSVTGGGLQPGPVDDTTLAELQGLARFLRS